MSEAQQSREPQGDKDGRLLAGRYRLGEVLGRGGMGTVWRAVDETLGRTVAVKELRFPSAIDDDEKRRLITRTLREAKAIARIRNTSAVTVYDVVDEDDRPWIVMELIEGKSLAEVIREDGTLTPRRAAEVGLAILDVLRSAHREGILHRDVKPSNVLISEDGRVVLTDFGIAQVEGDPSVTSTGMLVGAPSYISPERARGHKPGPPADLWSLGGLLYASVEGRPPYDKGSAIATLTAVMTEPVEPPANAGGLEEVIYGLLAKEPDERLDDAGARVLLNAVINAPEEPVVPPAERTQVMALPSVGDSGSGKGGRSGTGETKGGGRKAAAAGSAGAAAAAGSGRPAVGSPAPEGQGSGAAATSVTPSAGVAESTRDRLRGALKSARNAKSPAASHTPAATASVSGPAASASRPAVPRASITDVVPRRTLAVIAGVVVLAVLGTVLALTLGGDETGDQGGAKGGDSAASSGATTGDDTEASTSGGSGKGEDDGAQDGGKEGQGQGEGEASSDPSPSKETSEPSPDPDALPAGYKRVTDERFHFTMAMPESFERNAIAGSNSGGIYNESGGFPRVQVDYNSSPGADAAAAWRGLMGAVAGSSNGYKHIGIKKVEYNGYPTVADWEFTRNQQGKRIRVLNRGFKADATHGYSIMISCEADAWDGEECRTLRETAFATFEQKD
ncbi:MULTISPECIES: serine/threonine-protein kinase [Streptomyces]|uniref:non-specific serine/threonine protein kinase n=1 Tax=Streptomyces glycanivorans TaxID=3033808 RepID=A0ABY9JA25_9ACTN|nr:MULTISPECIES: serine/threonine-protein kinase [unclassified Streptomyces]WSQ78023.1 serine/threonine protein kinase [Streptomyces sp. NBC_01213]TXS17641.1 serine/threonine protein kinase [Streptomyces sp. wa22]WLQ64641.1 serine/threonine-protein kinase [Streptomyces sp. Alt3]WSQ85396.1 serine/threonine protein kinase [Streptomyces sp. NBC_01212]WSR48739.1 serine/threonine protein kinase [Streptomyces sp. NBC_01201]